MSKLEEVGIATQTSEIGSWDDLIELTNNLAEAINADPQPLLERYETFLADIPEESPSTLVIVSTQPIQAPNKTSWAGDLLNKFNATNIVADLQGQSEFRGYVTLSAEKILKENPELVLIVDPGQEGVQKKLESQSFWKELKATKEENIHTFDYYGLINPGSIDKIEEACQKLKKSSFFLIEIKMKVLITAFEPNDNTLNASELVVNSLQSNPTQELRQYVDCLKFQIMPGDTNSLGEVVNRTLNELSPDICLGIGQARGYNCIALERMAKNLRYFVTLDRMGNAPKGKLIVDDTPVAYWSSWPEQDSLVSLLESHNIPARVSNDCGTHLCNQVFYHCLHWREIYKPSLQVGFVHIPILPEQVIASWHNSPFMPMEMTRRALSLIIASSLNKENSH